jgi:hypothetical protein
MIDGLYRVDWNGICAGFVVDGGRITRCAPILRNGDWSRTAKWIAP